MEFELFEGKKNRSGGATVIFFAGGRVAFNAAAQRLLGEATHLQLLFDRSARRIGFRPTDADDPNGFKITRSPSQAVVSSRHFAAAHEIPLHHRLPLSADDGILIATVG